MLQIVEYAFNEEGRMPNFDILNDKAEEGLGDGQKIELEIANSVGVKVFRVWEPLSEYGKWHFEKSHVEKLISEQIRQYYDDGQFADNSASYIRFRGDSLIKPKIRHDDVLDEIQKVRALNLFGGLL